MTGGTTMSEHRFTEGNLIILYAIHRGGSMNGIVPDYIRERIRLGLDTLGIVMSSKPDRYNTKIILVTGEENAGAIKELLQKGGVDEKMIVLDSRSKNVAQTLDQILNMIKPRPNPPHIYFVGSVWLRDIYESIVTSKFRGYKVQFEGALDHRPVKDVEQDRALEPPKRNSEYYKRKTKDKVIDILLNYIFREKK
jgi:hypothetical protein